MEECCPKGKGTVMCKTQRLHLSWCEAALGVMGWAEMEAPVTEGLDGASAAGATLCLPDPPLPSRPLGLSPPLPHDRPSHTGWFFYHTLEVVLDYLLRHKFKSPTFWALTTGCDCSPES